MSKHDLLEIADLEAYVPPKRTTHCIRTFTEDSGRVPSDIKVLDWGCGRGLGTLWLREQGYDAFGVDIDELPVQNGRGLLCERGHPSDSLQIFGDDGKTSFASDSFDIIISNQVFEHVDDLESVAEEMWRIVRPGGIAYHVFPAHKYLVEGHLFMPLVHWLPKNAIRHWAINLYTRFGVEPNWPELSDSSGSEKAKAYYHYSVHNTFYRSPAEIAGIFQRVGFETRFETIAHPRVQQHWLLGRAARNRATTDIVNFLLLNFVSNELHLRKPE